MILNTGNRTDIPAYYSEWFYNRIKEKYVMVRNPYYPEQVSKYVLTPDVVDVLCFCTKNPQPMLERLEELNGFNQFWFVTITPYGNDIEPNVPSINDVIKSFKILSKKVGLNSIGWRYDPIFINEKYTVDFHIQSFEKMAKELGGYTNQCVISFIDLYEKTKKNFKGVNGVKKEYQELLVKEFVKISNNYNFKIFTCSENIELQKFGVDVSGCMTKSVLEKSINGTLNIPKSRKSSRDTCNCLLGNDIGMYNTCGHACLYCYANYDMEMVYNNMKSHNPKSPLLIGDLKGVFNKDNNTIMSSDIVKETKQVSYYDGQLSLF